MGEVKNQQKGNLKIGLKNKRIKEQIDVIIYLIHR
jgi:hypothetical protein